MGSRDETFSGFSSTHFIRFSLNYWSLSRFILTYHLLQTKRQQNGRTPGRTHFRIISSGLLNLGGLDAQLDQFAHPYCPQSPHLWLWTLQRWILSLSQADLSGGMCFIMYTSGAEEKLSCIQRTACEDPKTASEYSTAAKMVYKLHKMLGMDFNPKYETVLNALEDAKSHSLRGGDCAVYQW